MGAGLTRRLALTDSGRAALRAAEEHPWFARVSAELPETGERFEGLIPPIVAAPAFAIRKPAIAIFTLKDYASVGIMAAEQAEILRAVAQRQNVLVAGGT